MIIEYLSYDTKCSLFVDRFYPICILYPPLLPFSLSLSMTWTLGTQWLRLQECFFMNINFKLLFSFNLLFCFSYFCFHLTTQIAYCRIQKIDANSFFFFSFFISGSMWLAAIKNEPPHRFIIIIIIYIQSATSGTGIANIEHNVIVFQSCMLFVVYLNDRQQTEEKKTKANEVVCFRNEMIFNMCFCCCCYCSGHRRLRLINDMLCVKSQTTLTTNHYDHWPSSFPHIFLTYDINLCTKRKISTKARQQATDNGQRATGNDKKIGWNEPKCIINKTPESKQRNAKSFA